MLRIGLSNFEPQISGDICDCVQSSFHGRLYIQAVILDELSKNIHISLNDTKLNFPFQISHERSEVGIDIVNFTIEHVQCLVEDVLHLVRGCIEEKVTIMEHIVNILKKRITQNIWYYKYLTELMLVRPSSNLTALSQNQATPREANIIRRKARELSHPFRQGFFFVDFPALLQQQQNDIPMMRLS